MKYKITLFLLGIVFQLTVAQSTYFKAEMTESFKDIKSNTTLLDIHQLDKKNTILIRAIKKDYVISTFNESHKIVTNIELEAEKKESYLGSIVTGKTLRIFTKNKISKKVSGIYCRTFDPETQKISKKLLFEANRGQSRLGLFYGLPAIYGKGQIQKFKVSLNGEYFAFVNSTYSLNESISSVRLFNNNLEEVFNKEYFRKEGTVYVPDDFLVTNKAEVILAGKVYKKGGWDKKDGKANYTYEVHKISESSNTEKVIDLGDNFINELRFASNEEKVRMLGFYSENNSSNMKGGISFSFKDSDIENIKLKMTPFPLKVYNDIYGEAKAERKKKKEKEFKSYYLDYSLVDKEGNAYLTAEQFYITTTTMPSANGGFTTINSYHYDNILAIKFDAKGNMVWARNILKSASSSSYNAFDLEGKLHVFLNTGKNIQEKSNNRKKIRKGFFEKSVLYDIVFDENGNETYELIRENESKEDRFTPAKGSYDFNQFIMTNRSKYKKQFLILSKAH